MKAEKKEDYKTVDLSDEKGYNDMAKYLRRIIDRKTGLDLEKFLKIVLEGAKGKYQVFRVREGKEDRYFYSPEEKEK
ncbi:MAG: hypothetical protein UT09_C0038G0001, partial [Parcubacteria group bacterium GW2011_GWF2_38_8]